MTERMKVAIITPAHNEEEVIKSSLLSVKNLVIPYNVSIEHLVIADRCTDQTVVICRKMNVKVIEKSWRGNAMDPITETVDLGIKKSSGEIIGKIDADIILPPNWLNEMLKYLDERTVCASSRVRTRTSKWWLDFFMGLRDLNYRITPLGEEPRGAVRLIKRELLERIGGFDYQWASWDTGLDQKIRSLGYKSLLIKNISALEYRPSLTIRRLIRKQIEQGKARRRIGTSLLRTIGHSLFRFRPFVLWGYLTYGV